MGYPPNTKHWQPGDIVIHAADAKQPYMLMKVVGYTSDGLCKVKYLHPGHFENMPAQPLANKLEVLLDPDDFGIRRDV